MSGHTSSSNGADLEGKSPSRCATPWRTARIFGRIAPPLKAELVDRPARIAGHYVAMIGDGVNDILSLKKSNLAVAMGAGTQATKGVADLILLDDSFGSLASARRRGQPHPQRDARHPPPVPDADLRGRAGDRLVARRRPVPDRIAQRIGDHAVHGRRAERAARGLGARRPHPMSPVKTLSTSWCRRR